MSKFAFYILLIELFIFSHQTLAQWENVGRVPGLINSGGVVKIDSSYLFAGFNLYKTADEGDSWDEVYPERLKNLFKVDSLLIGQDYYTHEFCRYYYDGKSNFQDLNICSSVQGQVNDHILTDSVIVVCDGSIYISEDTVKSFIRVQPKTNSSNEFVALASDNNRIYAGTRKGDIWVSIDQGKNWNLIPGNKRPPDGLMDFIVTDSIILLSGVSGVWQTNLDTINWVQSFKGKYAYIRTEGLYQSENAIYCVVRKKYRSSTGNRYVPRLLVTLDTGKTWKRVGYNLGYFGSSDFYELDSNLFYTKGGVFRSRDQGLNWSYLNTFPDYQSIYKLISLEGGLISLCNKWSSFYQGMYVSKDDGLTWESKNDSIFQEGVLDVIKYGSKVLAITPKFVYELNSVDSNWNTFLNFGGESIHFDDSLLVILRNDSIWMSADSGKNWSSITSGYYQLENIRLFDKRIFTYRSSMAAKMVIGENYGQYWQEVTDPLIDIPFGLTELIFDGKYYHTSTEESGQIRSENGFKWDIVNTGLEPHNLRFRFMGLTNKHLLAVTLDDLYGWDETNQSWVKFTNDWHSKFSNGYFRSLEEHKSYLYLGGISIWRMPLSTVGYEKIFSNKESLDLYPIPNNGVFTFSAANDKPLNIFIYNLRGQEIFTAILFNGENKVQMPQGTNPGMYLLRYSSGEDSGTIKFIVE